MSGKLSPMKKRSVRDAPARPGAEAALGALGSGTRLIASKQAPVCAYGVLEEPPPRGVLPSSSSSELVSPLVRC